MKVIKKVQIKEMFTDKNDICSASNGLVTVLNNVVYFFIYD